MSTLVDALCAPDATALIYDTFNAASFLFHNAAAFCDAGIAVGPAPAQQAAEAMGAAAVTAAVVAAPVEIQATSAAPRVRKRRRQARSCKSKEETESLRMTHIAVERNRRRQMNEYLAVLRSIMPESYAQRGDHASIVGGAIEFVKELEQQLQSLEAQKRTLLVHQHKAKSDATPMHSSTTSTAATTACVESTTTSNFSSSVTEDALSDAPPFAGFFTFPQYVWCHSPRDSTAATPPAENGCRSGVADIEVSLVETHANLRVMTPRRPGQLLRMIGGLQALRLTVLHLTVTTLHSLALYSLSVKVEEGCGLTTVDDIAAAVHHVLCIIDAEAASQQLLAEGQ
ncbi:transcription factor bHLH94-like [Phragmites australis]|uniref:transcription factor bHLH94-like n=1 Tax=Phragmites australis TaxID=29695 RepID=UPI002D79585D|nr:transcription factor bHLH94-like [Phragmites australis]